MARSAGFNKEDVLEKAMRLFWARGYHPTSMKDLETAIDMRPGSIYAAFGSKEALFGEALQRYAAKSREQLAEMMKHEASPIAGLAAHIRKLGANISTSTPSNACMLVKTLLETAHVNPELRDQTEGLIEDVETGFADAFRQAQKQGQIDEKLDAGLLASRLQSDIFGMRAYAERSVDRERITQLADQIAAGIEALAIEKHPS